MAVAFTAVAFAPSVSFAEFDVWVSKIDVKPNPIGPTAFSTTVPVPVDVSVEVLSIGAIPPGPLLSIVQTRGGSPIQTETRELVSSLAQSFTVQMSVLENDVITATADSTDIIPEGSENNNNLAWGCPHEFCGDFPDIIFVTDPDDTDGDDLILFCETDPDQNPVSSRQTYHWPVALIYLPPYNHHHLLNTFGTPVCGPVTDPGHGQSGEGASIETTMDVTQGTGTSTEGWAGVTASAAVEAEFGVPLGGPRVTLGVEIRATLEANFGADFEQSVTQMLFTSSNTETGYTGGHTAYVTSQTKMTRVEYRVDNNGHVKENLRVWVALPQKITNNPELVAHNMSTQEAYRHPDAVRLDPGHTIGDLDSFFTSEDFPTEAACHIDATFVSATKLAGCSKTISSAGNGCSAQVSAIHGVGVSVEAGINLYAEAEIGADLFGGGSGRQGVPRHAPGLLPLHLPDVEHELRLQCR